MCSVFNPFGPLTLWPCMVSLNSETNILVCVGVLKLWVGLCFIFERRDVSSALLQQALTELSAAL